MSAQLDIHGCRNRTPTLPCTPCVVAAFTALTTSLNSLSFPEIHPPAWQGRGKATCQHYDMRRVGAMPDCLCVWGGRGGVSHSSCGVRSHNPLVILRPQLACPSAKRSTWRLPLPH